MSDIVPFRLAGNVYFVGTSKQSSHLIDTGDGLILLDIGDEANASVVMESMETLGFNVQDVKYILLSHGHYDHSWGVPKIVANSGATVFMFEADNKYLNNFLPDVYLKDGDIIRLGNTEILCLHTPGHTEGTASYFFDTTENGKTYRVGTFGGAGTNQLKKSYLDKRQLSYLLRGQFFRSIQRLRQEHVDVFLGNHSWQNRTKEKYALSLVSSENPFVDPDLWGNFLNDCEVRLLQVIESESKELFVNYAHRGASAYTPENTMLAFYTGIYMGANGIETDIRKTKDGVLVLFHDKTLERVTGEAGSVENYTFDELQQFSVNNQGLSDKILRFEDFLQHFAFRDITFAIELKGADVEEGTAQLLRKYNMASKTVVTSFRYDYLRKFKEYAPEFRVGLLTDEDSDEIMVKLKAIDAAEYCPRANTVTKELVEKWHREGFRVRAWGVTEALMQQVYEMGADGMTVNFPDLMAAYLWKNR